MKKLILVLSILMPIQTVYGQHLILTGTIKNAISTDYVEVNVPFDGAYHPDNSTFCKVNSNHTFRFTLLESKPKFATICYNGSEYHLILIPGKPLHINLNRDNSASLLHLTGKAAGINNMLLKTALNNKACFINNPDNKKIKSIDSIMNFLLPNAKMGLHDELKKLTSSQIKPGIKSIISIELKYYYADVLLSYANGMITRISRDAPWKRLEDTVIKLNGKPDINALAISPSANTYLHYYALQRFMDIGVRMHEKPDQQKLIVIEEFDMPFDTIMKLGNNYGEDYLAMLMQKKHLSAFIYEKLLANLVLNYTDLKDLQLAKKLQQDLVMWYPGNAYINTCRQRVNKLETIMARNATNPDIIFIPDSTHITGLNDIIRPYKGKIVYLDMWGTWCGPCTSEIIEHSVQLKEKFKKKDVVFLYLEMDPGMAGNDKKWKEFVQLHNVTGYHVRINGAAKDVVMENIWFDLLKTKNVSRFFPTYVIFDRAGNIFDKNAKRPSDNEELYNELDLALNK